MIQLNDYWQVTQKHKIRFLTVEGEGVIQMQLLRMKATCPVCKNILIIYNTELSGPHAICQSDSRHKHNFVIDPNEYEKPIVREKK